VGPAPELFTLDRVTVRKGETVVLDAISDHVHGGHCTAVVGPSGSGKTTLLRLLNRFEEPTDGEVRYQGVPLPALDVRTLRRQVGLLQQHPVLLTDTVAQEVRYAAPELGDDAVRALLGRVALPGLDLSAPTAGLSGGERQRLCLARALAVSPTALLLDEPTSALDADSAAAVDAVVGDLIANGLSVVLVSHDLDRAAQLSHDVLVVIDGRIADRGTPEEVRYLMPDATDGAEDGADGPSEEPHQS
jgi:putative ABC transport system ATP-binding protein